MATPRKYFEIPVGGEIGRFRIVQEIGRGGHGVVYQAEDLELGRNVALKTIATQSGDDRWTPDAGHEARLLARLSDPHVVGIIDFVRQPEMAALILELVEGPSLHHLAGGSALSANNVLAIGIQLAEGLRSLHRAGIVHGDLKPGNLRLSKSGVLKILDLSAARWVSWSGTVEKTPHRVVGTIPYMSPEQLLGVSGDPRSDIWSFGVVLFELATGRTPFELDTDPSGFRQVISAESCQVPDLGPDVPISLERIITRAITTDARRRFQSAGELLKALRSAAAAEFPSALASSLDDVASMWDAKPVGAPCRTDTLTVLSPLAIGCQ